MIFGFWTQLCVVTCHGSGVVDKMNFAITEACGNDLRRCSQVYRRRKCNHTSSAVARLLGLTTRLHLIGFSDPWLVSECFSTHAREHHRWETTERRRLNGRVDEQVIH